LDPIVERRPEEAIREKVVLQKVVLAAPIHTERDCVIGRAIGKTRAPDEIAECREQVEGDVYR
jgi:hypothetical protein